MKYSIIPDDGHETIIREHFGNTELRDISEIYDLNRTTIVCFTNRCGSTFLCSVLQSIGLMGGGSFEPLNGDTVVSESSRLGLMSFSDYYRHILKNNKTASNNFAFKASFSQLNMLINSGLFTYGKSNPNLIFIFRKNLIAQACSYSFATQTGSWNFEMPEKNRKLKYDKDEILMTAAGISYANSRLELLFDYYSFDVLRISYESLVSDLESQISLLRTYFNIEDSNTNLGKIHFRKQIDPVKELWERRVRDHSDFEL